MSRPLLRSLALAVALLFVLSACSVPEDDSPRALPAGVMPGEATPTPLTTGTTQRVIYLYNQETQRLQPVSREVEDPVTVEAVLAELIEDPTQEEQDENLVSVVDIETALIGTSITDDVLTIDLAATGLPSQEGEQLFQALAQLVYSLTERNDVEGVLIRVEGEGTPWPIAFGGDAIENEVLTKESYETLDPDFEAEPVPTPGDEPPIVEGDG